MSCLWDSLAPAGEPITGIFHGRASTIALAALAAGSALGASLESLRGRSVLIATCEQLPSALALVELDGVVRRMVLCTPDLTPEQLAGVAATADADTIILDDGASIAAPADSPSSGCPRIRLQQRCTAERPRAPNGSC